MKITTTIEPDIFAIFNPDLLSRPAPKFYDDSEVLWKVYQYIIKKLKKKCLHNQNSHNKFLELEKQFLELYERAKEKEKDLEAKTGNPYKEPLYRFTETRRRHPKLFDRLRWKAVFKSNYLFRKNYEV